MKKIIVPAFLAAGACLVPFVALAGTISAAEVDRLSADRVAVQWTSADPVDVRETGAFDASSAAAKLLATGDTDGRLEMSIAAHERPFFLIRDRRTGDTVRVAERIVQLEQGTNFRDLGGYPAADGRHVRWGMLYRSGGQAMLTDADVAEIKGLGIANLVDLRSDEERSLAPTRLDGIPYQAVGYSMGAFQMEPGALQAMKENPGAILIGAYHTLPELIAPQIRIVFRTMLAHQGPLLYNCSAGQDRTGLVSALILSALGVPRDRIYADYVLTTTARRGRWELPPISSEDARRSSYAAMWAAIQKDPYFSKPIPLIDGHGVPYISVALGAIEKKWGSVDIYLEQAIGLSKDDIKTLRASYLE